MDLLSFFIAVCGIPVLLVNLFGFRFIGLTGGISTGKSTVSRMLREWGVPVIDFDMISRDVVKPGSSTLKHLEKTFGKVVINADGSLNRTALGNIIFNDPSKRKQLNAIMQRPILIEFARRALVYFFMGTKQSRDNVGVIGDSSLCPGLLHGLGGTRVIVLDVPLLFEAGIDKLCSETVFVDASESLQLQRLMTRDGISEAEALAKVNAQMKTSKKKALATCVIDNNGGLPALREATRAWLCGAFTRCGVWDANEVTAGPSTHAGAASPADDAPQEPVRARKLRLGRGANGDDCGEADGGAAERILFAHYVPGPCWYLDPRHWLLKPTVPALVVTALVAVPGYFVIQFFEKFLPVK